MVTKESIEQQLKDIKYNFHGWGKTEVNELPNVIMPDEKILECVNGIYEGGFALLVATNFRVLLVDKKPFKFLNVEDLRFDMINEIDYSHRLLGARISISTGSKNLRFLSYNQPKLRELISHVQHAMAESKKQQSDHQEDQKAHLEQINQQLQAYLLAQHQQQQKIQAQLERGAQEPAKIEPVKPAPELADYLYAQSLLEHHQQNTAAKAGASPAPDQHAATPIKPASQRPAADPTIPHALRMDELYQEGVQEVFGRRGAPTPNTAAPTQPTAPASATANPVAPQTDNGLISPVSLTASAVQHALEINPLRIAYSRLPMAMRNRKFGRPSFHAHSQQTEEAPAPTGEVATAHS